MIFFMFFFFDTNLNYFKISDYKGFYLNNSIFYSKSIINIKEIFITEFALNERNFDFIDNKLYTGLNFLNFSFSPSIGYKSTKNRESEIYYGAFLDFRKSLGNTGLNLSYEFYLLKELSENIINFNMEIIDTFFLNFSLSSFIFSVNENNSYLGTLSASFLFPYKFIYYGGGLSFKFLSKGNVIPETSYFNFFSPVNIFLKIGYNKNKKNNVFIKFIVSTKNNYNENIECNMKMNEKIYKIKGERIINIIPGRYKLKFYKNGYDDFDTTLVLSKDSNLEVFLNASQIFSNLTIKIIDKDEMKGIDAYVEIIENNIEKIKCDKSGVFSVKILPGSYVIRISKEGYLTKGLYLDIEPSQNIEKIVVLQRLK